MFDILKNDNVKQKNKFIIQNQIKMFFIFIFMGDKKFCTQTNVNTTFEIS